MLKKKLLAVGLSAILTISSALSVVATGVQNDTDGNPFAASQLGEWVKKADGKYYFMYTEGSFEDHIATQKGLVPITLQGLFENPSNWAKSEVVKYSNMGLNTDWVMTNYQDNIKRAPFIKMLVQMFYKYKTNAQHGVPSEIETDIFSDIDPEDDLDILHGYYLGITKGAGHNKFLPDSDITREEAATMYFRLLSIFDDGIYDEYDVLNYFADYEDISTWAKHAVATLGNREVIKGFPVYNNKYIGKKSVSNEIFMPKGFITSEQALCLTGRIAELFLDEQVQHTIGSPQKLSIENGTKLKWNPQYGADGYEVYRYEWLSDTEKEMTFVTFTNTANYELKGLKTGVYDYTVVAKNEWDRSLESEALRVTVAQPVKKNRINLVPAINNTAVLDWENVRHVIPNNQWTGATHYTVTITDASGKVVHNTDDIPEVAGNQTARTKYTLTEDLVQNVGSYTIKIYAWNKGFVSAPVTIDYTISKKDINDEEDVLHITPIQGGKKLDAVPFPIPAP